MDKQVEIVNYHPDYGESLAEMWNRSQEAWGGGTSVTTGDQVRRDEENSDSLAVFLAVYDNQVVAYCSLSEYTEDEGALYIHLLNVRPDYHGKKIGKMLVLRAVEETVHRGWPRVDLYTWESNMKAVPLYKRCGFFWEDREDTTHFMNFIPQIINCEAILPYMADIDWYADSSRTIEVVRDGHVENGFHTYTYTWNKNGRKLRVDIERRGRGICLIETEDYLLSAMAENAEPVFGKEYTVQYRIVNKSGAPLRIEFEGESDRNISFNWKQSVQVEGEQLLTARFFVGEIAEEQSEWRTCPTVRTNVTINGLQALLQVGVFPKFPASLEMKVPDEMYALQGNYEFYMDIENHYPEAATFSFELPPEPWLELMQRKFIVSLQPKERVSLSVPCRLLDYGFYSQKLSIQAAFESAGEVTFTRTISGGFSGPGGMCIGETERSYLAMNGKYKLKHDKESNELYVRCSGSEDDLFIMLHPMVGKPYSGEFSKKKPEKVKWKQEQGAAGFWFMYRSSRYTGLLLHVHILLYADGTVKSWQELENVSISPFASEIWVSQRIHCDLYRSILPYGDQFVEMADSHSDEYEYWDSEKMSEPWMFSKRNGMTKGICWSDSHRMSLRDWFLELETDMGCLNPKEVRRTGDIILTAGSFSNWKSFRKFALKRTDEEKLEHTVRDLELTVNRGNPFVKPGVEGVPVILRDLKRNIWEGQVSASFAGHEGPHDTVFFSSDNEITEARFTLSLPDNLYETVQVDARLGALEESYFAALFPIAPGNVEFRETTKADWTILEADNGSIRIMAAGGYYPGLHSIRVNGHEWLASGYPDYGAKSWWNPWTGGMNDCLDDFSTVSILKEERVVSSVQLPDNKGNIWSGIRVRLSVHKHKKYRGLTWDSYYLMLPGVPVLAYMADIRQETGIYFGGLQSITEIFFPLECGWIQTAGLPGEVLRYRLGEGEILVREASDYVLGREEGQGFLHVVTDESQIRPSMYANKEISCLSFYRNLDLPHGSITRSSPTFFVFTDDILSREALRSLRCLTFSKLSAQQDDGP
ncbi:GNAT family N-acetyltransferase [Paenibacillus larvae]|uniref:GNAT family N-acetyltransferase n=1 Tax=Paenibacillus larvae TaxID=1464 RepID=A0AAP5JUX8_9BACL|nr:GNAT family N-acetyltransferase [Paenibacillus larvae]AQR77893.1 GNAT family N-acetyltransferase [Paenibacillus larvae subsp. larvae]AVF20979.1 putative N-acetyltransferase YvbK [Paenibacillus larvae subsp. larvae]ETK28049.1 hypothetical protein ERIC1_1c15060 [Paenibacillus larvae subsp. larvae DSM 25719]MCY7475358.1 GNAT family N-acetyltransferase [Paenibacillus larvae]MCY7489650.1 GNAT family N-acetyltransferase [Paenibacillus larvae]